jgi:ubiquinone/menaquinone biosynthesis C-methylase UbiE
MPGGNADRQPTTKDMFEQHGWDDMVTTYELTAEPNSRRFAEAALDRAAVDLDSAILDVAAGTGSLALTAVGRGYREVSAIDSAPDMVRRLARRLSPFPGCSAEVMDARDLRYPDDRFGAAFCVFGVLFLGAGSATAVSEMVRVVRPGGIVSVVHWAGPVGAAPVFVPLARAIRRLDDPEVGEISMPITTDNLEKSDVARILTDAGCADVQVETVEMPFVLPALPALQSFFRIMPQYNAAVARHQDAFLQILEQEMSRLEPSERVALGNIGHGRVPAVG